MKSIVSEPSISDLPEDQQGCATQPANTDLGPVQGRSAWIELSRIAEARAALADDDLPSGRHMIAGYRMMAKHAAQSEDHDQRPLADVFDLAAKCIENELAYFRRLQAAVAPILATFPPHDLDSRVAQGSASQQGPTLDGADPIQNPSDMERA